MLDTTAGRQAHGVHGRSQAAYRNGLKSAGSTAHAELDKGSIKVLIVDDEHTLRESCASVLSVEGFDVSVCGRGHEALTILKRRSFDIVLLDLNMSQVSGMELLEACLDTSPQTIAIIMTGNPSVTSSIEALRAGAWDYLPKPFAANHLQMLLGRAAHAVQVSRETATLDLVREETQGHCDTVTLLGVSPAFRRVVELARKVASTDASVFITGESGTGKEQIAQFIHHHSRRSSRQLVAVNCAALPEALLETEMFGHMQGAFTGAVRDKAGLLEVANGGTLFLDEITEMPLSLQAKLLRVVQDGVVRRLGSTKTDAVVNVRFIAATNRNPQRPGSDDSLRSDLFYRLCVVPIHIPPLRERTADIPVLAEYFLEHYWTQHRGRDQERPTFGAAGMEALCSRHWPGNVRELQNVIEHAVVLLDAGAVIGPEDLPNLSSAPAPGPRLDSPAMDLPESADESYHGVRDRVLVKFELGYLTWLVARASGNMSKAARIAGVDRTTLYRLMEKHGLQRDTIITTR
ncbi:MAG TPA: sigma-54 dependent transcriptional regulator [Longimicrobiales bacterium]